MELSLSRNLRGPLGWTGLAIALTFGIAPLTVCGVSLVSSPLFAASTDLLPSPLPELDVGPGGQLTGEIPLSMPGETGDGGIDLALSFTGGHGGLLGNWDVTGLSSIERDRREGIEYATTDGYIMDPGGHLVKNGTEYRSEQDTGAIFRPTGSCGNGPCSWIVVLPDGGKMFYGEDASSRVMGPSEVVGASSSVLAWHLSRVMDRNGNYAVVNYDRSGGRMYPVSIEYSRNDSVSLSGRRVEFLYDSADTAHIQYHAGRRIDTGRHLRAVRTYAGGSEVFSYEFQYSTDARTGHVRLTGLVPKLRGVQQTSTISINYRTAPDTAVYSSTAANTGAGTPDPGACKVAADICYVAQFANLLPDPWNVVIDFACRLQSDTKETCATGNTWGTADLNGDGRVDFTAITNAIGGDGRTVVPFAGASAYTAGAENGEKGTSFLVDMNGDGRDDLVGLGIERGLPTTYSLRVSFNTGNSFAAPVNYRPTHAMGMGYDPDLFFKELLLMWIGAQLNSMAAKKQSANQWFTKSGKILGSQASHALFGAGGYNKNRVQGLLIAQQVLTTQGSQDNFTQIADMNGDGLVDYVRLLSNSTIAVALNTGSGFGSDVTSNVSAGLSSGGSFTPSASASYDGLTDLDGDGDVDQDDLATLPQEEQQKYVNVAGTIGASPGGFRSLGDVNGDGIPDFIALVKDGPETVLKAYFGHDDASFSGFAVSEPLAETGSSNNRWIMDANADGYADFVRLTSGGNHLSVTYGTGTGFGETIATYVGPSESIGRTFADINGDGCPDFVRLVSQDGVYRARVKYFKGTGYGGDDVSLGFEHTSSYSRDTRFLLFGDTNGDGRAELIAPRGGAIDIYGPPADSPELIQSVTNGYQTLSVEYRLAADDTTAVKTASSKRDTAGNYSVLANTASRFLATAITLSGKTGNRSRTTYQIEDDLIKMGPTRKDSRGLGPAARTVRSYVWDGGWVEAPTYTVERYYQSHPVFGHDGAGLPQSTTVYRTSDSAILQQQTTSYQNLASVAGTKRFVPYQQISTDNSLSLEGGGSLAIRKTQTVTTFDDHANATCSEETISYNGVLSSGETRSTQAGYAYPTDVPGGRPVMQTVYAGGGCTGAVTSFTATGYDTAGNPTLTVSGTSAGTTISSTRTFDAVGNVTSETRFGLTTSYEYDAETRTKPTKVTSPLGLVTTSTYDTALGLLLTQTDPDGRTITHTYDELGRELTTTLSGAGLFAGSNQLSSRAYYFSATDGAMATSVTRAVPGSGTVTETTLADEWGRARTTQRTSAGGIIVTENTYDAFDRVVSQTLPHFVGASAPGITTATYDSMGRLAQSTHPGPNGTITENHYPGLVSLLSFTSAEGVTLTGLAQKQVRPNGQILYAYKTTDGRTIESRHTTSYSNAADTSTRNTGWNRTRYHYDEKGRMTQVTRGVGTSTSPADVPALTSTVEYDDWGRKTSVYDPDKGTSTYTYTAEGYPLCTTEPNHYTQCKTYDAYGRVTKLTQQSDGKVLATYTYDEGKSTLGNGKLTSVTDEAGTRRLHYDSLTGKVKRIERHYQSLSKSRQFDVENTYDEAGGLVARAFPAVGMTLRYEYHPGGPLSTVQLEDPDQRIVTNGTVVNLLQTSVPDALGNSSTITYGNGVTVASSYTATGSLQQITATGNGQLSDYKYSWTDEGLLAEKDDQLQADGIDRSETFTYDGARRLVSATGAYGTRQTPRLTYLYAYGTDGQPLAARGQSYEYNSDAPHRVTAHNLRSYTYDETATPATVNGRVVERSAPGNKVTRFQYHWTGRIKQAQTIEAGYATTADYEYDSEGNRFIKRTDLGTSTTYEIAYLAGDYQIETDGTTEVDTLELRNGNTPVGRFRFNGDHHLKGTLSSLFSHRLGQDLVRIANLEGGISKLPVLAGLAFTDTRSLATAYIHGSEGRIWRFIYWSIFALLTAMALVALAILWRRHREDEFGFLPMPVFRSVSVLAIVVFSATIACVPTPGNSGDSSYLLLANGSLAASSEGYPSGSTSTRMSTLGSYYYITSQNGSTDIVTDSYGKAVARFAYDPYGRVNQQLTDLDPDRNSVVYGDSFFYTGQELEAETGLYDYHARIYDPETGRFLQPDPVHTENAGMDNWDRYAYVNGNPVNFTDPTGEAVSAGSCHFAPIPYIYGRYTGPGACRSGLPGQQEDLGLVMMAFSNDPDLRQSAIQYYFFRHYVQSPPGKTTLDEGSRVHDRDGGRWSSYDAHTANAAWIRHASSMWYGGGLLGPIPTARSWDRQYHRDYEGLRDEWGTDISGNARITLAGSSTSIHFSGHIGIKHFVAAIATTGTLMADYAVTLVGTALFGTANLANQSSHWLGNQLFGKQARFIFHTPGYRSHNWSNPKKWKL